MNVIYLHGLDGSSQSNKAKILRQYIHTNHQNICVHTPDLNIPPEQVMTLLLNMVDELKPAVLVGSSLGGFFSTLVSNQTGCPIFLLNPSINPYNSLQRFFETSLDELEDETVGYVTTGGWSITKKDMLWFQQHHLTNVAYADKATVLLKQGDELLDYKQAETFFNQYDAKVIVQAGGDHRMSDFDKNVGLVMDFVNDLVDRNQLRY